MCDQLIIGLYLIAGLRLDIWNLRLLWCIPVSVFLFSVFYSISVVAGLRWRSPILAIGATVICGAIFFVVGFFGQIFDQFVNRPPQVRGLARAGTNLIGATAGGGLVRFDRQQNQWIEVIEGNAIGGNRVLTPITLNDDAVATARVRGGRFNPFGTGAIDLLVVSESSRWTPEPSLRLPTATTDIYAVGADSIMAMNTSELAIASKMEILAAASEPQNDDETPSEESEPSTDASQGWLSKLTNMMGGVTEGFHKVLPDRMTMTPPRGIVVAPEGDWLIGLTRGNVVRLERPIDDPNSEWTQTAATVLDGDVSRPVVIAHSGQLLLVAREEEPIRLLDTSSLELVAEVELPKRLTPTTVAGLGENRFAIVTADGRCRFVENTSGEGNEPVYALLNPLAYSDVQLVLADEEAGELWVVHNVDQIDRLDLSTLDVRERIRPSLRRWRLVNQYVMTPLRFLVPQTGELVETITAIVSGKSTLSMGDFGGQQEVVRLDIFRPLFSCSIFIVVMLTVGCVYFSTRDL